MQQATERRDLAKVKTIDSTRTIEAPAWLMAMFAEINLRSEFASPYDLVFCTHTGRPHGRGNMLMRGLYPAMERAGLQRKTFHALRYTHASLWIKDGGDVVTLSKRLGHSTPQVTVTTYMHAIEEANDGLLSLTDPMASAAASAFIVSLRYVSLRIVSWFCYAAPMSTVTLCQFPGCESPVAASTAKTGRRPAYCDDPQHTRESAFRERQRLRKEGLLPPIDPGDPHARPVSMAATSLALNLEGLTSRATELRDVADRVDEAVATITDSAALELELDALRAGADLEVSRVRAELAGAQQRLSGELEAARAQHAAERQRAATAQAELADARDALERARGEMQDLRAAVVSAQEDRAARERAHASELEEAHGELAGARAELERVGAELERAVAAAEEHGRRSEVLRGELDEARRGESVAREALAAERAAREGAQRSADDARQAAAQAERAAEQLVASERARADEARASAHEARAERDRALDRASRAEKHAERLQDRVTGLEAHVDAQPPSAPKRPARSRKPDDR